MKSQIPADLLADCVTFADVLNAVHQAKLNGSVIVHFAQGHAVSVEVPRESEWKNLDTGKKRAQT